MSRVVVIGAGRQGPAVAYDLAKFANVERIVIADYDYELATAASVHVNSLLGSEKCEAGSVNAADTDGLAEFLTRFDLAIAAAPYRLNPNIAIAGIQVGCSIVDMGVDTPDALEIHARSLEAQEKGISVVTDCGVAPGLVNILAYKLLKENPETTLIKLYCGGLPETAEAPFFHKVGFSVDSLLGEYVDEVDALKDGRVIRSEALQEFEVLDFGELGTLEAVTTSGGTGTAPHHLKNRLQSYEYKTLRFPGHWGAMLLLRDAGFWSEEPLLKGCIPREVTLALMERQMVDPSSRDIVVVRVIGTGPNGPKGYELIDRFDPKTGFTAMQRTTGFSTAIIANEVISGNVAPGSFSCEVAVDPDQFFHEAAKRDISIHAI